MAPRQYHELSSSELESSTLHLQSRPTRSILPDLFQFRHGFRNARSKILTAIISLVVAEILVVAIFGGHLRNRSYQGLQLVQDKSTFVKLAQDTDIDGVLDLSALRELCQTTTWRDGLVFAMNSDEPVGGMCNIRNAFINYLKFALEAGASIVLPDIWPRNVEDPSTFSHELRDFSFLFDRAYFKSTLQSACPKIKIYDDMKSLAKENWAQDPSPLCAQCLAEPLEYNYCMTKSEGWRGKFEEWVSQQNVKFSAAKPHVVMLGPTFLTYQVLEVPPQLVRTIGRLFRPPPHVRDVAARVLEKLDQKFALNIDPSSNGVIKSAYYGAHLRTESDATKAQMTGYDAQAAFYIEDAANDNLSVMYAASHNVEDLARLKADAKEKHGIEVTTKYDLLELDDLEALLELSFDQAAMVDYEILLRSSRYGGITGSSFSYNIAIKRATTLWQNKVQWTEKELDAAQRPWWHQSTSQQNPNDPLSTILGSVYENPSFGVGIWP